MPTLITSLSWVPDPKKVPPALCNGAIALGIRRGEDNDYILIEHVEGKRIQIPIECLQSFFDAFLQLKNQKLGGK